MLHCDFYLLIYYKTFTVKDVFAFCDHSFILAFEGVEFILHFMLLIDISRCGERKTDSLKFCIYSFLRTLYKDRKIMKAFDLHNFKI